MAGRHTLESSFDPGSGLLLQGGGYPAFAPGAISVADKYVTNRRWVAAMDTYDELYDLRDEDDVAAHRAKAKTELDQIARQVRQALTEQGINTPVFFLVPNSGDSILAFGTPGDPDDHLWNRVGEIVSSVVRQTVGLDRVRCRPVTCAATSDEMSQPTSADEATSR